MNLGIFYDQAIEKYKDQIFMRYYDRDVTYAEYGRKINILANALRAQGFQEGDFIHVLVQNSPETLISYYAIQKIGAIAGPINGWWKAPEVEYLLNDSRGKGLIIEDQYIDILTEIRDRCPHLETVIEIGENPKEGHIPFESLFEKPDETPVECRADAEDIAYIFYTSGTTGNPKGVLLSHKNVLADVKGTIEAMPVDEGQVCLVFLPLFHVNAMLTSTFCFSLGIQLVLRKAFSASEFWEVVEKYGVNFWSAVPAVYQILLTDPSRQKYDLSSMKFGICGAAPLTEETMRNFEETFNIPILEGYGLTEATCVSTINPVHGERKVGSIGLPLPGQEVLIVDEAGNELPKGEQGEIVIRGDAVMVGYFNRPEETAETLKGGFLHTGDVGYKDEDGYIFIVDRLKDMIIRGGENIYPREIEEFLIRMDGIRDVQVAAVPSKKYGEEVGAFIIARESADLEPSDVIDFCRGKISRYKIPRYVHFVRDYPMTASGKIQKYKLTEMSKQIWPDRR